MATNEVREAMVSYWSSYQPTLESMMLDSEAERLTLEERVEILSYLPPIQGKKVLELGAGIGRYTGYLAKQAEHVVAVDFIQKFVDKNAQTNGHLGNIEFVQADVTQLMQPRQSYDVIFTNWLLMYLDDDELLNLVSKMLLWLKDDGHLFVRESCFHPSGKGVNRPAVNPTFYRSPTVYIEALQARVQRDNQTTCFQLIKANSLRTYVKFLQRTEYEIVTNTRVHANDATPVTWDCPTRSLNLTSCVSGDAGMLEHAGIIQEQCSFHMTTYKNNPNQLCFLLHKIMRISGSPDENCSNFQAFLDQNQYTRNNILIYERIFGPTFVSTGGRETTVEFCEKLDLKAGESILDVGCGIGGSAFYMAKTYNVHVHAVDLSSNMISLALEKQLRELTTNKVYFEISDITKENYPAESLDVIYSRDAILHIENKEILFANFAKWLKPGGRLLISDYCRGNDTNSREFRDYVNKRRYFLRTVSEYGELLEKVGFIRVNAEDRTSQFVDILRVELCKFEQDESFVEEFSHSDFVAIVDGWNTKIRCCLAGDQAWGLFTAIKPGNCS